MTDEAAYYSEVNGFDIISCPVEQLHFRGRKAEAKERFREELFFITNYPDMILVEISNTI